MPREMTKVAQAFQPRSGVFGQTKEDSNVLYFATAREYLGSNIAVVGEHLFALDVGS